MSARALAIRFGSLHDNLGEPKRNGILLVENGRIARVASPETALPADVRLVDAACVVPGLINAHVHLELSGEAQTTSVFVLTTPTQRALACAANARKTLEAGVTTVRDLGSSEKLSIDVRDAIDAGRVPGPGVVAAGRAICITGGHGWFLGREADGDEGVRKAVREQRRDGADCIKFIATGGVLTKGAVPGVEQLTEDELRSGVAEARRHGMACTAHAIGSGGVKNALRAGVDSVEHGHLVDDEGVELFLQTGAYLVPTLAAIACIVEGGEAAGMPDFVLRKAREIAAVAESNLRKALRAGVRFAAGSDAGTPFNHHDAYARELELMQSQLGMTPREALFASTRSAAELLRVSRGALAPGDVADLVVLRADLESDARPFRDPVLVLKGGAVALDNTTRA